MVSSPHVFLDKWLPCLFLALCFSGTNGVMHMDQHSRVREEISEPSESCSLQMFGGDRSAVLACLAEQALQRNWYPSPIAGLFSYQVWNGFDGFWQNGILLETMVNFMKYANHTRYRSVVTGSLRDLGSLLEAYYPQPSFDDMAWYGISYAKIYEVLGNGDFLAAARTIYDWNWQNGWDTTVCDGGMWFDQTVSFKATITNVQMFQLGAKLYLLTGKTDEQLLHQVNQTWTWLEKSKIVDSNNFSVYDSVSLDTCEASPAAPWTYNSGVLIGGLVLWANITGEGRFTELAHKIANSTVTLQSEDGVLTEQCDFTNCGDDSKVFKGIFMRNLRYLMDVSDTKKRESYSKWLDYNADVMLKNASCWSSCDVNYQDGLPIYNATYPVFDSNWHGPFNWTSPKQQAPALDLLVSAVREGTRCMGPACSYDPPVPPPRPMTCKDNPCPSGEQCCEYQGGYRTCCTPDQRCVGGFCE